MLNNEKGRPGIGDGTAPRNLLWRQGSDDSRILHSYQQVRRDFDAAVGAVWTSQADAWDEAAAVGAALVADGILHAAEVADRLQNVALAVGLAEFYGLDEVQRAIAAAFTEARAAVSYPEMMEAAA